MAMHRVTYKDVIARLEENDLVYGELPLNNIRLIVTERGGRILGLFGPGENAECCFWINPVFADARRFRRFLDAGEWNLGGERVWVAPEIQYSVRDRSHFWETLKLPAGMDPGNWTLQRHGAHGWRLNQTLTLEAANLAQGRKQLSLERCVRPAENPLQHFSGVDSLMQDVTYAGYEHVVSLSEASSDRIMSESWNLAQVYPGGRVLIPASPAVTTTDYFEPVGSYQTLGDRHVELQITGDSRYKVGYKAAHHFGRLGYLWRHGEYRATLIVRAFFNNPSAPYVEEPADQVGQRGHSLHIYNDGGMFGGFGELECNGQTIGGATGRASSTDAFMLWFYTGARSQIRRIVLHLLGIDLSIVRGFEE